MTLGEGRTQRPVQPEGQDRVEPKTGTMAASQARMASIATFPKAKSCAKVMELTPKTLRQISGYDQKGNHSSSSGFLAIQKVELVIAIAVIKSDQILHTKNRATTIIQFTERPMHLLHRSARRAPGIHLGSGQGTVRARTSSPQDCVPSSSVWLSRGFPWWSQCQGARNRL